MANPEHLEILKQGVKAWNAWRTENSEVTPDLSKANLTKAKLPRADLTGANLSEACLWKADLTGANLSETDAELANLNEANLSLANLYGSRLNGAGFSKANLTKANLREAGISDAYLLEANLLRADLYGTYLYGSRLSDAILSKANLARANFESADLSRADLSDANLSGARLWEANLTAANLTMATFLNADLWGANLSKANLSKANLRAANLTFANLSGANLSGTDLEQVSLVETIVEGAMLTSCRVYGISVWNLRGDPNQQTDLYITREDEPEITVDNLEVAQFVYMLVKYKKLRDVIDTITSKVVLILGRFSDQRKPTLDAMANLFRKKGFVPVLFDFEKTESQSFLETVETLARLARFIIADFTDAKMVGAEVATIASAGPPILPVLLASSEERDNAVLVALRKTYRTILDTYRYDDTASLLASLEENIVEPANAARADSIEQDKKRSEVITQAFREKCQKDR